MKEVTKQVKESGDSAYLKDVVASINASKTMAEARKKWKRLSAFEKMMIKECFLTEVK